jgi:4-methylaminobutanoate oxidase (formaldehyde-forming)
VVGREQVSTRTGVTVFDQTSFSKYVVAGPGALAGLQWVCTADVDVPVGRAVYTALLNARGTYESDLTVTRTGEQEFLLVSSAATTVRDQDHLRRHLPADVTVTDVTSTLAVFGVMGPRSRDLLTRLTDADLGPDAFAFGDSRLLDLGPANVRATRITYVGELGWELYVPVELAVGVYQDLLVAGADLGVRRGGYYAIESLRLEKGYRAFGRELTPDHSPVQAGLLFACKLGTGVPFLGREALEKVRADGPRRRLVSFVVEDAEPMLWGGELLLRDGPAVRPGHLGRLGSRPFGACVGLAYVWDVGDGPVTPDWVRSGDYEVDVGGDRYPVRVTLRPPYDPGNERVR